MTNNKLNDIFDKKVEKIKTNKYNVNSDYANLFLQFVVDVLREIDKLDFQCSISVKNDAIGKCLSQNAKLTEYGLHITLVYAKEDFYREKGYDDDIVNKFLNKFNIVVHTVNDGEYYNVYINYNKKKNLNMINNQVMIHFKNIYNIIKP